MRGGRIPLFPIHGDDVGVGMRGPSLRLTIAETKVVSVIGAMTAGRARVTVSLTAAGAHNDAHSGALLWKNGRQHPRQSHRRVTARTPRYVGPVLLPAHRPITVINGNWGAAYRAAHPKLNRCSSDVRERATLHDYGPSGPSRRRPVLTKKLFHDPAHWHDRADDARRVAAEILDPVSRRKMLEIAESYESLAATRWPLNMITTRLPAPGSSPGRPGSSP
jgi:hypothetical protein